MELEKRSEGKRDFGASYLYRVAYSTVIDEIRRVRRRNEVPLESDDAEIMDQLRSPGATPQENTEAREVGRGISNCLQDLNQERRSAVTLYLLGHSVPDAARILRWTAKRTENLVYRGLSDLRQCLSRKGLQP